MERSAYIQSNVHNPAAKTSRREGGGVVSLDALTGEALSLPRLSDEAVIAEAIRDNLKRIGQKKTLAQYQRDLEHFAEFLESSEQTNLYDAKAKHVSRFLSHMEAQGGTKPDPERECCSWCKDSGYPDGRNGCGWSATRRKGALSAIRFLYHHFEMDDELPSIDPSNRIASPKVSNKFQFTPSKAEVERILETPTDARTRLIIHWAFYAPSRRQTFVDARWEDIDLEQGVWHVVGKNGKPDTFELHPELISEFRAYLIWVRKQAKKNPLIREALEFHETAFVLLTNKGKPLHASSFTKAFKAHGVKAGVGVKRVKKSREHPNGLTSDLTPHSMRRAWASIALNDLQTPIEVVSEVLKHQDISTTKNHYAKSKPERAQQALIEMSLS